VHARISLAVAKTKISIVRYLNSVPLAWGILEGPYKDYFEPVFSTPAECADQLGRGAVDVGLIPSIEFQRIKGTKIIPGPVIASSHRVKSVLLVSEMPLWRVRTVAHDRGSRTSVVLARIIFNEFYRIQPDFRPADPDLAGMLATSDAALIIGDAALKFMEQNELPDIEKQKQWVRHGSEPLQVFDLVERWKFLTGLPFVFAFWAARDGFRDKTVVDVLNRSRDFGLTNTAAISERYSVQLSMNKDFVREYLEKNVYYYMNEASVEGLELFYTRAARVGAIKSVRRLEFL
jgi:chorismate dehydratase